MARALGGRCCALRRRAGRHHRERRVAGDGGAAGRLDGVRPVRHVVDGGPSCVGGHARRARLLGCWEPEGARSRRRRRGPAVDRATGVALARAARRRLERGDPALQPGQARRGQTASAGRPVAGARRREGVSLRARGAVAGDVRRAVRGRRDVGATLASAPLGGGGDRARRRGGVVPDLPGRALDDRCPSWLGRGRALGRRSALALRPSCGRFPVATSAAPPRGAIPRKLICRSSRYWLRLVRSELRDHAVGTTPPGRNSRWRADGGRTRRWLPASMAPALGSRPNADR